MECVSLIDCLNTLLHVTRFALRIVIMIYVAVEPKSNARSVRQDREGRSQFAPQVGQGDDVDDDVWVAVLEEIGSYILG